MSSARAAGASRRALCTVESYRSKVIGTAVGEWPSKRKPACLGGHVYRRAPVRAVLALASLLACFPVPLGAGRQTTSPPSAPQPVSDLDALMAQALAQREVERSLLNQYVLDETESFEVLGP